ncbi:MAG: molybdopterin-synthase adenylyltransferase MoeB [bacterium]|nr:molybdopterin-synthase adenylyltransferase MoeB [bacterium]
MDYTEQLRQAQAVVTEIEVADLIDDPIGYAITIDVRETVEHDAGALPGSVLVPLGQLEQRISELAQRGDRILLYCAVGVRSAIGAHSLVRMGFTDVTSLAGGYNVWRHYQAHGKAPSLTPEQRDRYARHLTLSEVGEAGQERLLNGSTLIVGAGGLGSPAALYLAAAGVGQIGLVDADKVELSNLQRQIVHNVDRLGRPKAMSAAETIDRINPQLDVRVYETRLVAGNVLKLMDGYDVIIDATDNFPTRYLLNDASLLTGKPIVHGSIFRFEGQASVFQPGTGPCYRCVFPQPPPPELAPNCTTAGVLGVLPGTIGSIQATEAIKLILGIGDPLVGRLVTYDALDQTMMSLNISRNPECASCGDRAPLPQLVDYDETCVQRAHK